MSATERNKLKETKMLLPLKVIQSSAKKKCCKKYKKGKRCKSCPKKD
jgi:hypothetical protein